MAIAWSNVTDVAPELATGVPAGLQTTLTVLVNADVDDAVLGNKANLARAYLAAHFATLAIRGDVPGPVVGESIGDISVQYGNNSPMGSDPMLDSTPYGKAYRYLCRISPEARGGFVLNGGYTAGE